MPSKYILFFTFTYTIEFKLMGCHVDCSYYQVKIKIDFSWVWFEPYISCSMTYNIILHCMCQMEHLDSTIEIK